MNCIQFHLLLLSSTSIIQPFQDITTNNCNIFISFPEQQRMHHTIINLDTLVLTFSQFIQFSTHIWISNNICTPMNHNERNLYIPQFTTNIICYPQEFKYCS
ncbi:hypothetical protein CDL12_07568 [Handroanthus impetiginosus]|uniref:Non-specific serine/threonine protein kinase n=1 Tax=Handroanthus impetiginosus TaxID=429701 RepID=A0A2G9HQE8_9LAMI|nr:hypothetical protein CDL12_07568 [Handroanthus impetiginosus]